MYISMYWAKLFNQKNAALNKYFAVYLQISHLDRFEFKDSPSPIYLDCIWGTWESWSDCIRGKKTQRREKVVEERSGGTCDGCYTKTKPCGMV